MKYILILPEMRAFSPGVTWQTTQRISVYFYKIRKIIPTYKVFVRSETVKGCAIFTPHHKSYCLNVQ